MERPNLTETAKTVYNAAKVAGNYLLERLVFLETGWAGHAKLVGKDVPRQEASIQYFSADSPDPSTLNINGNQADNPREAA